ncbi:uncharacterized protein LOC141983916 [Natator depressus]|uniref:uncharacterized protein LOC141983916 n=1 Tax=Natator depressus TaxID=27790 RepID=UPI003EC03535
MQSSSAQVTIQSQNHKRAPAWTKREVRDLITVWGDESVLPELRSKRRNAKIFEKISKGMKDRGYNRDPQQCSMKLKELRQAYQRTREAIGRSGSEPQTCRFYEDLQAFLGGSPTTTPALCVDSVNGLSHNRDADFGDKEDDKEKEVEAQQASGETVFPNSQEQFLTLDLVPSQPTEGGLPDPEGGEGTSAPNVSSLHVSSLSQRLSKIKSWKKRKLICSGYNFTCASLVLNTGLNQFLYGTACGAISNYCAQIHDSVRINVNFNLALHLWGTDVKDPVERTVYYVTNRKETDPYFTDHFIHSSF